MSVDRPCDIDVIDSARTKAIRSTANSLLGLHISDWMFLLAGVGIAAVILLIA